MLRIRIADCLTLAIETLVAILVLGSIWPLGSVQAVFQMILLGGVGVVLVLWALKAAVLGRPVWKPCLLVTLVAAFCCVPILQTVPMSRTWIATLAPGTARWLQEFRPPAADVPDAPAAARVDSETLSFDAGETRDWLFRLIGFAALFVAIRNNLTSPASAFRFAWLCIANAALLAIVGIGQMTSSPESVVYWRIQTEGSVFGPFVCRNHAAYVLNLAIGLAFGLLLGTRAFLTADDAPTEPRHDEQRPESGEHRPGRRRRRRVPHERSRPMWAEMLTDPKVAWLLAGIGICVAGLIATLSRGGAISILAAGAIGLAALGGKNAGRLRWMIAVPIVAVAFAFLAFSGFERVTRRWDKLVDDAVTTESRAIVWKRTTPLIGQFPVFGSGWGTFIEVEPTTRKPGDPFTVAHDYAHNDFLQLWIEGGTLQIVVTVLLLFVLYRQGFRAIDRHRGSAIGRLALGAMVGVSAVVFHSFVDFGLHVPAVAVLTATVAAFLANLADLDPKASPTPDDKTLEPRPLAMVLQVVVLVCVAGYLGLVGYRQQQAERYRIAAQVAAPERRIAYLETTVAFAPEMLEPRIKLASAYMERAADRVKSVDAFKDDPDFRKACPQIAIACRLSPLSFDAQERLRKAQELVGDTAAARRTVDRLLRISPSEPYPWYLAGRSALDAHDEPKAIAYWRNCLRASPRYLPEILQALNNRLTPEIRSELFSEDPALLMKAAEVAETKELFDLKKPLLEGVVAILSRRNRSPEQDWMLGKTYEKLGEDNKANSAMRQAWEAQPRNTRWGADLAQRLFDANQFKEALTVATTTQSLMSNPNELDPLIDQIRLKIAQGK